MKKYLVVSLSLFCFLSIFNLACSFNNTNKNAMDTATVTTQSFGTLEGKSITEYTLTNAAGMQVGIINYGAKHL